MGQTAAPPPIKGVYAALATPRRKSSTEIDMAALLDYLDTIVQSGVDGLVLFGSTGEFIHFDIEERVHAFNLAIRRSRVPVLVNISHSTLDGAVSLAEHAITSGAAGLVLMPPYFYSYTDDQIEQFYLQFADIIAERSPVYLYNLPLSTNPISASLAGRLLSSGRFAGIKDSSGDWELFEALQRLQEANHFQLLIGNESIYLRGLSAGANGIVSGVAAAIPELVVAMDRAVKAHENERAHLLDQFLQAFLDWVRKFPSSVGIKQTAVVRGWRTDHFAVPLPTKDLELLHEFHGWLEQWLPNVLKECTHA